MYSGWVTFALLQVFPQIVSSSFGSKHLNLITIMRIFLESEHYPLAAQRMNQLFVMAVAFVASFLLTWGSYNPFYLIIFINLIINGNHYFFSWLRAGQTFCFSL